MKYLVAVDGSESSMDALDTALETAEATSASVVALHVVVPELTFIGDDEAPTSFAEASEELLDDATDAEERGQRTLERAQERAEKSGIDLETGLLYGEPVEAIVEYADANDVDVIYIGHRGLSERFEGLLGSTAKEVVGRATVPVTVVR